MTYQKGIDYVDYPSLSSGGDIIESAKPYGVWTGSFNLTDNATQSLENALYLTAPKVVEAYYREWGQIAALSEPLDWLSDWTAPEWRLGS